VVLPTPPFWFSIATIMIEHGNTERLHSVYL